MNTAPLSRTRVAKRGGDRAEKTPLQPGPTLDELRGAVAAEYGMTVEQLISYRNNDHYHQARAVFCALAWEHTTAPWSAIHQIMSRSHSWKPSPLGDWFAGNVLGKDMRRRIMERLA